MKIANKQLLKGLSILSILSLAACGHDDNDDPEPPPPPVLLEYSFEVTVTNLTNAQPLSPVAVVAHGDISLWEIGTAASPAIENMAESGDNSDILANTDLISGVSGAGVIFPGMSETIVLNTSSEDIPLLSVATMLVNTNDAYTGRTSIDISGLAIGDNMTMITVAYDAGTEANSELTGTIPGPADGGEGFNAARDDVDYVAMHPGVVSMDDGLSTSVLTNEHKFDNPIMKLSITRL